MQDESNHLAAEDDRQAQKIELLAAVVLHVLVTEGHEGIDADQMARTVERDHDNDDQRGEVAAALQLLAEEDLARREGERWQATRAALAAARLSF
jgi:hypothetical protein